MTSPNQTHIMLTTTTTASLLLLMSIIGLVSLTNAQSIEFSGPSVYDDDNYGPVVYVGCRGTFRIGSNSQKTRWIFSNRILTVNGALGEGESPKYAVTYSGGGFLLHVRNPVKEDIGIYQCQLAYDVYNYYWEAYITYTYTRNVTIDLYLPDANYPECSIIPSTTLTQGTELTFNCTVGESVPGVNLQLFSQNSDGTTYPWFGGETLKTVVSFHDHGTSFICLMTSNTFPTAGRTCTVGPIIVPFGLRYGTTTTPTHLGPCIDLHCRYMFSAGSTGHKLRWMFNDAVMAENNEHVHADPSRYSVKYRFSRDVFTNSILYIQNAVKEDEGDYQCQVEYIKSGETQQEMIHITVPIESYLPALNYPECSIGTPSINAINETTFYNGTEATFNCTVGESVPNVNLQLILQRPDGTTKELGNATVTRTITMVDNNAIVYCFMTSDTFLSVNRSCAAGPITVLPQPTISVPTTEPLMTREWTLASGSNSAMQNTSTIIAIVGGTIGGIVILILIVILVLRCKMSKSDTQSSAPGHAANNIYLSNRPDDTVNNSQASLSPGSHQLTQPTLNQDDAEYAVVNNPNNSSEYASSSRDDTIYENTDLNLSPHVPQPSMESTNQEEYEPKDDDIPVYETTEFDKLSPAASDSSVYSQVNKVPPVNSQVNKYPPVNSQVNNDPPVYSQVNKGVKTDEAKKFDNKDKSHRESSGFVDNILYISSGPANADDIAYSREDDTNIYESTDIDTSHNVSSPAAPHPPIYSEVNKRAKTGTDDVGQVRHRESSGFVDNKIYVSSGPSTTDDD